MRFRSVLVTTVFTCLVGSQALAQVPTTGTPDRIDQRFKPIPVPQAKPEQPLPQAMPVAPPDHALEMRFTLTAVTIDGSTVFKPADFAPLYQPLLCKSVTLVDMYRVRDAITAKYRAAGYTLSQAIIAPQSLDGGVVHIQVVEGYIHHVSFEGDAGDARGLLAATARKIEASRPFRQQDMERYILLLNDLPGVEASPVLKPSAQTPAAADLVIVIKRHALAGSLSVDNRGSKAIGPVEASASIDFNDILGLDEQTSVLFATAFPTRELRYVAVKHTEILNSEGWRLTLSASNSLSKPGGAIAALAARGTGTIASVFLTAPVLRTRAKSLKLEAGFTYQNTRTDLLSALYSRDRVRFLAARASYDFSDNAFAEPASTLVVVEADQGLDVLNATKAGSANLSRANGRSDYTLISGEMTRVQSVASRLSLALSLTGQYSFTWLLSSQQFGLGGRAFGRGYEPSELTGDNGVGLSIEPRLDLPLDIPSTRIQAYAFYDVGEVWTRTPLAGAPGHESLSSAGGGIRAQIGAHFSINLEIAKPLTHDIASRGNRKVRPLFTITTSF